MDFTSFLDAENVRKGLKDVFKVIEERSAIRFEFKSFHATKGSIIANLQSICPLKFKNRIRLDISLNEIVTEPVVKVVKSEYPDIEQYKVKGFSGCSHL